MFFQGVEGTEMGTAETKNVWTHISAEVQLYVARFEKETLKDNKNL